MLFAQLNFRRVGRYTCTLRTVLPRVCGGAKKPEKKTERRSLKPERMGGFKWCSASNPLPPPTSPNFRGYPFFPSCSDLLLLLAAVTDCCISLSKSLFPQFFFVFLFSFILLSQIGKTSHSITSQTPTPLSLRRQWGMSSNTHTLLLPSPIRCFHSCADIIFVSSEEDDRDDDDE